MRTFIAGMDVEISASVTRSSATPPRRASSSSSSDTADAGAADDGDYELEERTRSASWQYTEAAAHSVQSSARHTPTIGDHPHHIMMIPRGRSPICRGSGVHPHRHPSHGPRLAGDRGSSPSPVPIGGSVPCSLFPIGPTYFQTHDRDITTSSPS
jgi:hypothetical protein